MNRGQPLALKGRGELQKYVDCWKQMRRKITMYKLSLLVLDWICRLSQQGGSVFLNLLLFCVGLAVEVREEDKEDGGVAHEEERQGLGQLAVVGEKPNHVGNHETELDLKRERRKHQTRAEKFGAYSCFRLFAGLEQLRKVIVRV